MRLGALEVAQRVVENTVGRRGVDAERGDVRLLESGSARIWVRRKVGERLAVACVVALVRRVWEERVARSRPLEKHVAHALEHFLGTVTPVALKLSADGLKTA